MSRWFGSIVSASGPKANLLYPFTTFTFLPIVAAGSNVGPTLAQMQTAYTGQTWLTSYFTMGTYQGYQRWTAPASAAYSFEIGGAMGGTGEGINASISTKVYGAKIVATMNLNALDVIEMVIGGKGGSYGGAHGNENGGGGGTFIKNITTNQLLFVAGGSGGTPAISYGTSCTRTVTSGQGQTTQASGGMTGCYTTVTAPAVGTGGASSGSYSGGAGGGYVGKGGDGSAHCSPGYGGAGYDTGCVGGAGNTCYTTDNKGGFGGGGGGNLGTPGGGGGYTGGNVTGAWSSYSDYGGGGGSFAHASASGVSITAGGNTGSLGGYVGAGYCKITLG